MNADYKKIIAIRKDKEKIIRAVCPLADNTSGIYCFYRTDENGIKHAYVGQATRSLQRRMAEHLMGYQYIDLSLKKHGFYDAAANPFGYRAIILTKCSPERCDEEEKRYILEWSNQGYQLKNRTAGSQGVGKNGIAEQKQPRGYYDGKKQGYLDARKFIRKLFDKNLVVAINGKETVNKQKALQKFYDFIAPEEETDGSEE